MVVELHVVSDATGETAARLAAAVERQFPSEELVVVRHPRITSVDDVQLAAMRARGRNAVVLYTLVEPRFRDAMRTVCKRYRLHYCDLLGHPIEAVAKVSGTAARMVPGALPPLDSTYFRRVAAIEFAVRFDDGLAPGALPDADVVLVGVSRTSKTPLSIYLGYLGYKAANIPIVLGIDPPEDLWKVDQARVVGLTIQPERLVEIRSQRVRNLRGSRGSYARLAEIQSELDYASSVHRRLGCPVIDVTNLAIEETAHRVLQLIEQRHAQVPVRSSSAPR
jgi:regulator of PEP synthase PpsR (kinase-PPPase family)